MLSGSFHTSHAKMCLSSRNAPTTPFTYASRRGYCVGSVKAIAPGDCTQPELCMPGRLRLASEGWVRVPTRIEQHQYGTYLVLGADVEKLIDALFEAFRILFPEKIVQVDAHRIHAQGLSPT